MERRPAAPVAVVPLTCGQASAWMNFDGARPEHLAMPCWWTVAGDVPAGTVAAAVRALTDRHEMLRTTVVADGENGVRQMVCPPGPPTVRMPADLVVDLADDEARAVVLARFTCEPFDLSRQWPVRWFLGRQPSGEHALVAVAHHFALGYQGCLVIRNELPVVLANLGIPGRAPDAGLPPVKAPRALLAEEDSPRGRRQDARARDHLRSILSDLPSTPFPPARVGGPAGPAGGVRRVGVTLASRVVHAGAESLSARWRIPVSFVMLAAFSLAVRPLLVDGSALVWQLFGDRAGRHPLFVSASYQPVTTLVSAAGLGTGADLRAASVQLYRRMVAALRARGFGESAVIEEVHRVSRERGVRVEVPFWFNFVADDDVPALGPGDADRWSATPQAGELTDYEGDEVPGDDFRLYVWHDRDRPQIGLYAHERFADAAALREVFARFCAILRTHAVPGAAAVPAVPPPRLGASSSWVLLGGNRWGNLAVVRDVLAGLDGVESAEVDVVGSGISAVLRAEIRMSVDGSAEQVRTGALAELDVAGFVLPDVIDVRVSDDAPGDAPAAPDGVPGTAAAALPVLVSAIRRSSAVTVVDPATSYLSSGGEVRAIPAVLHAVRTAGWTGLTWRDLCSHQSLHALAAALTRR